MPDNFLVIRIHPDSPVDGGTFSTYLEGLQVQVILARTGTLPGTATLLGETKIKPTSLNLVQVPWTKDTYVASVSKRVADPTTGSGSDFVKGLNVKQNGASIAFGSVVVCPADTNNNKTFADNTDVSSIPAASNPPTTLTLTLNQTVPKFVAEDTLVTFYFAYGPGSDPSFQFDLKVKGAVTKSPTVKFDHSDGIAVGMTMSAVSGVPANTTVIAVPDGIDHAQQQCQPRLQRDRHVPVEPELRNHPARRTGGNRGHDRAPVSSVKYGRASRVDRRFGRLQHAGRAYRQCHFASGRAQARSALGVSYLESQPVALCGKSLRTLRKPEALV